MPMLTVNPRWGILDWKGQGCGAYWNVNVSMVKHQSMSLVQCATRWLSNEQNHSQTFK